MNPYTLLRIRAGLSQSRTGALFGYSSQYIHRVEKGLVNSPPLKLAENLLCYMADATTSAASVVDAYFDWVTSCREQVKVAATSKQLWATILVPTFADDNIHPLVHFIRKFNLAVAPVLGFEGSAISKQLFNRIVCLHPTAVYQAINNSGGLFPPALKHALSDIGMPLGTLYALEDKCVAWKAQHG